MNDADVLRLEGELSDEDRALLDQLAEGVAARRLTAAAMFFLESVKPLGFTGSQVMVFLRPIVSILWPEPTRWDRLQAILERRGAIELLLRRLEARA